MGKYVPVKIELDNCTKPDIAVDDSRNTVVEELGSFGYSTGNLIGEGEQNDSGEFSNGSYMEILDRNVPIVRWELYRNLTGFLGKMVERVVISTYNPDIKIVAEVNSERQRYRRRRINFSEGTEALVAKCIREGYEFKGDDVYLTEDKIFFAGGNPLPRELGGRSYSYYETLDGKRREVVGVPSLGLVYLLEIELDDGAKLDTVKWLRTFFREVKGDILPENK
jgi:hypothetical protein